MNIISRSHFDAGTGRYCYKNGVDTLNDSTRMLPFKVEECWSD